MAENAETQIGFDLAKADKLVETIGKTWKKLILYQKDEWKDLRKILRNEWIGPDEQQFEQTFVTRIKELYELSGKTVANTAAAVLLHATTWANWQLQQNKLEINGAEANSEDIKAQFLTYVAQSTPTLSELSNVQNNVTSSSVPTIIECEKEATDWLDKYTQTEKMEALVEYSFKPVNYESGFRGLKNGLQSAQTCRNAVKDFVDKVKQKTNDLFEDINTNKAFFGNQAEVVKKYITSAGDCVYLISSAVKDLDVALDKLAGTNYTAHEETAIADIQTAGTDMETTTTSAIANSKWDSDGDAN